MPVDALIVSPGVKLIESKPINLNNFTLCSNHSCRKLTTIKNFQIGWSIINKTYSTMKIASAKSERDFIAIAIGQLEQLTGKLTDAAEDKGRNRLFQSTGQMDCIDESVNTTTYLHLLDQLNLLKFHRVGTRQYRIMPHYTASIIEKNTNIYFAVDSWFYDNGVPPEIVRLKTWQTGYSPSHKKDKVNLPIWEHLPKEVTVSHYFIKAVGQEEH